MIYTLEQKAKIDAEEARVRAARLAQRGNVTRANVNTKPDKVNVNKPNPVNVNIPKDRAAYMKNYMRDYRQTSKKPKKCPHCGGEL